MQIIPAIDIRNGKCVRLFQGNFDLEKIYSDDPVSIAKQWEVEGALKLHVVDLDGAKNGALVNFEIIKQIAKTVAIPLQVGGGIRNKESVKKLLDAGVYRIILGTIALEEKIKDIVQSFPTQIAVALDTKNGNLMKNGWTIKSNQTVITTIKNLEKIGIKEFIYTDVIKDGTITEPNFEEIKKIMKNISVPLIVGGGITTTEQIKKLKALGVSGVILGKALYENKINLKEVQNVN